MSTGIYKITSPSGKIYVGQTWRMGRRRTAYKMLSCKPQKILYNSLVKFGFDNHKFEIVCILPDDITQSVLDEYEIFVYNQFKEAGYRMMNIKEPGSKGKHSEETKRLIALSKIGKPLTQEHKDKLSKRATGNKYCLGRILSDKTKEKMSLLKKGKPAPEYAKRTIKIASEARKKPVIQLSLSGIFIKEWPSATEAGKGVNRERSNITAAINGRARNCAGFLWKHKIDD